MNSTPSILDMPPSTTIDLAVLAVKEVAVRCLVLSTSEPVTLRGSRCEIPGEILTVAVRKVWRHKTTNYIAGDVIKSRSDVPALGLKPLTLHDQGMWSPNEEYWGDDDCLTKPLFDC